VVLGVAGVIAFRQTNFLGCAQGGFRWLYLSMVGNFFEFLHMAYIVAQCILCVWVIYRIPKRFGIFGKTEEMKKKEEEEAAQKLSEFKQTPSPPVETVEVNDTSRK
jgi:uncharacterized membrane protein